MRPLKDVMEWYRNHQTAAQLGYQPNGMCLKICREAAGKAAVYPSAFEAQRNTPQEHRVYNVSDLRKGMVLYYDDPRDSNRFGHIVTMIGRVKGADPSKLSDILVETNSVKTGEVVVVRGDYFPQHWGDPFVFGATWLNGSEIDFAGRTEPKPPVPPKPVETRGEHVDHALKDLRKAKAKAGSPREKAIATAISALRKIKLLGRS